MIEAIRQKISRGLIEFTQHAVDQSIVRHISLAEIREALSYGEIIEDYPDDYYGASCLVLGFTLLRRPLHIQCSHPERSLIKIITLYQPDESRWIDFRTRRRTDDL